MYVRLVFVLFKRKSGGVGGLTGAREVLLSENLSWASPIGRDAVGRRIF